MFIKKQIIWFLGCLFLFLISGCGSKKDKDIQPASVNQPKKAKKIKELYLQLMAEKELNSISNVDLDQNDNINSEDDKNKQQDFHPVSVMIKIYQLKDNKAFIEASYKNLLREKTSKIEQDILTQYEIILKPKDKILLHRPIEKDTIYIGVVGFFRKPDLQKNDWKIIIRRDKLLKDKPRIIEGHSNALLLKPTKKELKKQGKK